MDHEILNKTDEYESKYFWESPSEKKEIYKILGVSSKIDCDAFLFDPKEIIEEALSSDFITKRVVLNVTSSVFDPLGIHCYEFKNAVSRVTFYENRLGGFLRDHTLSMEEGGPEGFCGSREIFQTYIDRP